jgi:PAS domain S-box-containing protein
VPDSRDDKRRAAAIGGLAAACIALVALAGHQAGLDETVVENALWAPRMSPGTAVIVALLAFTMASSSEARQAISAVAAVGVSSSTLALWATSEPPLWMADPTTALLGLAVGFAVLVARQPGAATLLGIVSATIGGLLLLGLAFTDPTGPGVGSSGTTVPTVAAFVALGAGWGIRRAPTDDPVLRVLIPGFAVTGGLAIAAAAVTTALDAPIEWRATTVAGLAVIGSIGTGIAVARRALRTTDSLEQAHRALLNDTSHAMLLIRHDGTVTQANSGAHRLFGQADEALIGTHFNTLLPAGVTIAHSAAAGDGDPELTTDRPAVEITKPDGSHRQVRITMTTLPEPDGPPLVAVALTDVTELADQTRAAEARVTALENALQREMEALDRLRELDETKDLLITSMSHEVRTPLTVLLGVADLLTTRADTIDPLMQEQLLHRMARQARRLAQLVDDLLDVDDNKDRPIFTVPELTRVDLIARDVAEATAMEFDRRVVVDVPPVTAYVDPRHLTRILTSLVSNACKYAPLGPVHVDGEVPEDGHVRLSVEDHGQGIPDERRNSIFRPFERGSVLDRAQPGVGIGLAIVQRLCDTNNGRCWVEDGARSGGARFVVELPVGAPVPPVNGDNGDSADGAESDPAVGLGDASATAVESD